MKIAVKNSTCSQLVHRYLLTVIQIKIQPAITVSDCIMCMYLYQACQKVNPADRVIYPDLVSLQVSKTDVQTRTTRLRPTPDADEVKPEVFGPLNHHTVVSLCHSDHYMCLTDCLLSFTTHAICCLCFVTRGQSNLAKSASNLLPSLWGGGQGPRLTECSLGLRECSSKTGSWSVQPFLHSEADLSSVTDTANVGNYSLRLVQSMQPTKPGFVCHFSFV